MVAPKEALVERFLGTPQGKRIINANKQLEEVEKKQTDGNNFKPILLQMLKERLSEMGHEPNDEELLAVANSDMGRQIISLFEEQINVNNELQKEDNGPEPQTDSGELVRNMNFIRDVLIEKGMEASEEEIRELAGTERGRQLVAHMKSLKNDQAMALLEVPIVQTFRAQLKMRKEWILSDDHFKELLNTNHDEKL